MGSTCWIKLLLIDPIFNIVSNVSSSSESFTSCSSFGLGGSAALLPMRLLSLLYTPTCLFVLIRIVYQQSLPLLAKVDFPHVLLLFRSIN